MPLSSSSEHRRCHCRITPHNSSPAGQQTPTSLLDRRRWIVRCPFIQCQRSQASPFNFPTITSVQSLAQSGRTAPPLRKVNRIPRTTRGGTGVIRSSMLVLGSSLFLVFFPFFFFLHLQKEKAVVLEYAAPHCTDYTYMPPCVVPRILCPLERVSLCASSTYTAQLRDGYKGLSSHRRLAIGVWLD